MNPEDLQQIREVVREEIRNELKPMRNLIQALADSFREFLKATRLPIAEDIQVDLERKFEREGMPLR